MSTAALPPPLRDKLAALAWRVRRLRAVRGVSVLLLVLAVTLGGALLADAWLGLPALVRGGLLLGWVGLGTAIAGTSLAIPLVRRIEPEALAALVEERFPELTERLTTTVGLAGCRDARHGSPALIALLAEETEVCSRGLDFGRAAPARPAVRLAGAAGVALLLLLGPVLAGVGRSAELVQRFFVPWRSPASAVSTASEASPVPAVEPVELAASSVTVLPPEYARNTCATQELPGLGDVSALQYSRVRFDLRFTRPAVSAVLEWSEQAENADSMPVVRSFVLSPDGRTACLELLAAANASYRLVLSAEPEVWTELGPWQVAVQADQPPVFLRVSGGDEAKTVLPHERIPLEVSLVDDVGVERAEIEYRVNGSDSLFEAIDLDGRGTREARGRYLFRLAGKVRDGDEVQYRIRAADNRRLEQPRLEPHVVYYPAAAWYTLKITRQAEPLRQRENLAERDAVTKRLNALVGDLQKEIAELSRIRQESRGQPANQARELNRLRQENRSLENALNELSRDVSPTPTLGPLAERAADLADGELRRAGQELAQLEKEARPEGREQRFENAAQELNAALKRLEELRRLNERLAQDRLDQRKLELTGEQQQQLAQRAAELTDLGAEARKQAERLGQEQAQAVADVQRLAERNEALRSSLDAARAEQARQLAGRAKEMAQAQRDAARAGNEQRQKDLERQAGELSRELNLLAGEMDRVPLAQQAARKAAQASQQARDAMRQAQDQDRQGKRSEAEQSRTQAGQSLDQAARQADEAAQQMAARGNASTGEALRQAQEQMTKAQGQLEQGQPRGASEAMAQAAQALEQAARRMAQQQAGQAGPGPRPGGRGADSGGLPDLGQHYPELKQHTGKPWGELPGELRTRILQDMKTRYGDDYARMIKLYFEQIADTKRP